MRPRILTVVLLTTLGLATPPSLAQESNSQLQQAVCSQDWRQAIGIVDQMIAATPQPSTHRAELEAYRNQLQGFSSRSVKVPNWAEQCTNSTEVAPASNTSTAATTTNTDEVGNAVQLELVASNLNQLVAMTFDSTGRLFFTEKTGRVRLLVNGELAQTPVISFNVDTCSERGLLGITLDPAFDTNHYVYVYYTVRGNGSCSATTNQVVRFTEVNGVGQNPVTIFSSPAVGAGNHNGGNLHFGLDGKLYVSVGDDSNPANSQDLSTPNGKIHRINSDGTIPTDNPFYGQAGRVESIFAYGLRNSFDFDVDPLTGALFASENGPSCDDEVNRILPGYNYGWRPNYPCGDNDPTYNTIPPLIRWTPPIAPTGITFYRDDRVRKPLFMCSYDGKLHRFPLSSDRTQITEDRIVTLPSGVGCNAEVETGPDGSLYFVAGGGYSPATLYRIVPE